MQAEEQPAATCIMNRRRHPTYLLRPLPPRQPGKCQELQKTSIEPSSLGVPRPSGRDRCGLVRRRRLGGGSGVCVAQGSHCKKSPRSDPKGLIRPLGFSSTKYERVIAILDPFRLKVGRTNPETYFPETKEKTTKQNTAALEEINVRWLLRPNHLHARARISIH